MHHKSWANLVSVPNPDFGDGLDNLERRFGSVFLEKRLELKSLKGWTKAEELRQLLPQLLSLRPPLKVSSTRIGSSKSLLTCTAGTTYSCSI